MSSIKLKSNQKLKIKGRALNVGSLFSRFENFNLDDSDNLDNLNNLDNKIKNNKKSFNKSDNLIKDSIIKSDDIQKKKDIKLNVFEIRNQTKSIKDATPIKNQQQKKSINDRLNIIRNIDKELSLDENLNKSENSNKSIQKKELIKDKLTNNDLYAKRISKKLNDADFALIRFIVDTIGPKLAFELSNKAMEVSNKVLLDDELEKIDDLNRVDANFENLNSNLNKNLDSNLNYDKTVGQIFTTFLKKSIEIDRSIDLNEKFIRLIIDNKNLSSKSKQAILDFKIKNQSIKTKSTNKSSKRVKLKRIKKKVDAINFDFGNLQLTTNPIKKNLDKKFDFK